MSIAPVRPPYRSLPIDPAQPAHSAWGLYGADDERGALNLLTPARVAEAAMLVRMGKQFRLDLPLDEPQPAFFSRVPMRHEVLQLFPNVLDDRVDGFFPQASTQWDALSHFGHSTRGFYNNTTAEDAKAGRLSIDAMAGQGLAGRAVLADVAAYQAQLGAPFSPDSSFVITPDVLRATLAAQGTLLRPGDLLLVRTGWLGWFLAQDAAGRQRASDASRNMAEFRLPGLGPAAAIAEFLWDAGVALVATDTPMVEVYPIVRSALDADSFSLDETLHSCVMALLGIPLGEFFVLDELAADCQRDARWDGFFTSAPLRLRGGIGSPPNVIVFK